MPELDNRVKHLMYKGKPLVRENNIMCYGDMDDDYILFMMILSNKTMETPNGKKEEVPDMVLTQVLGREPVKPGHTKIVKQWTKIGLCDALDVGIVTLDRLNSKGE